VIIGHKKIIQFLNKSIVNDKLAHAYLFVGPEHLGKRTVALEFAKALQCQKGPAGPSIGAATDSQISPPSQKTAAEGRGVSANGESSNARRAKGGASVDSVVEMRLHFCGECRSCQEIEKNSHPDVLLVEPEIIEAKGKTKELEIGIGKIRDIRRSVSLFPYYGPYKIIIIDQADRLSREAANAFLKTLEEPTSKTIIILISSSYQNLLSTIVSRCLLIKFLSVGDREITECLLGQKKIKFSDEELKNVLRHAVGRPGIAISYLDRPEIVQEERKITKDLFKLLGKDLNSKFKYAEALSKDTELATRVLNQWISLFRDSLLFSAGCDDSAIFGGFLEKEKCFYELRRTNDILKKIVETKYLLGSSSFNSRLILEGLMLSL